MGMGICSVEKVADLEVGVEVDAERSRLLIWSSPLRRIYISAEPSFLSRATPHTSSTTLDISVVLKAFSQSSLLATAPFETLEKTCSICKISDRSFSLYIQIVLSGTRRRI